MSKNILFSLIFLITCIGCAIDDFNENVTLLEEVNLFTITILSNFYSTSDLNLYAPKAILTNANGEIISEGTLANSQTTELIAPFDIENETYDLNLLRKTRSGTFGKDVIYINTFVDIPPHHFRTSDNLDLYNRRATVAVEGIPGFSNGNFGADFYGGIEYHRRIKRQLIDDFFVSMKSSIENFRRYFWFPEVTIDTYEVIDVSETIVMDNPITIAYPECDEISVTLEGSRIEHPDRLSTIFEQEAEDEAIEASLYVPDTLFDNYRLQTELRFAREYFKVIELAAEIDTVYTQPDFQIDFIFGGSDLATFSTENDYDYYQLDIEFISGNDRVFWTITGKAKATVNYELPDIFDEIIEQIPDFKEENLELESASLYKVDGFESYTDFIISQIDPYSEVNFKNSKQQIYTKRR